MNSKIKAGARRLRKLARMERSNAEAYHGLTHRALLADARKLEDIADTHETIWRVLAESMEILRGLHGQQREPHKARKLPHKTWLKIGELLRRVPQ